ncbi:MAG: JDVT-CTERM system glutamic-type intramembrane protease [Salinisphaera sp.]|jgi:membrane protease YdiL (CAAX protease family)|nr:JDVT-CTERM system glutamic-type intramembrane protease [Salinisphaera sp.]
MTRHRAWANDPALWLALAAALPTIWLIAAGTPLVWLPHWPGSRAVLIGVVMAPALEELVFRGGLQEWLLRCRHHRPGTRSIISLPNLATSLVFALAHLLHHPPLWAAGIFLPSLVFGALYERRRQLRTPMLVHAAYNAAYLCLLGASG